MARAMKDTDLLFRVRQTRTFVDGRVVSWYYGPYDSASSARSVRTQTRTYAETYSKGLWTDEVEMEVCMPEWKVFE